MKFILLILLYYIFQRGYSFDFPKSWGNVAGNTQLGTFQFAFNPDYHPPSREDIANAFKPDNVKRKLTETFKKIDSQLRTKPGSSEAAGFTGSFGTSSGSRKNSRRLISASQLAYKLIAFGKDNNERMMELMSGKYSGLYKLDPEYLQKSFGTLSRFSLDYSLATRNPAGMALGVLLDMTVNPFFQIQNILAGEITKGPSKFEVMSNNYKQWIDSRQSSCKDCMTPTSIHKLGYREKYNNITFTDITGDVLSVHYHPGVVTRFKSVVTCFTGNLKSNKADFRKFPEIFSGVWVLDQELVKTMGSQINMTCGNEPIGRVEKIPGRLVPMANHYISSTGKTNSPDLCLKNTGRILEVKLDRCKWNPEKYSVTSFSCSDLHEIDYVESKEQYELMIDNGFKLNKGTLNIIADLTDPKSILNHCTDVSDGICKLGFFSKMSGEVSLHINPKSLVHAIKVRCKNCQGCLEYDEHDQHYVLRGQKLEKIYKCDNVTVHIIKSKKNIGKGFDKMSEQSEFIQQNYGENSHKHFQDIIKEHKDITNLEVQKSIEFITYPVGMFPFQEEVKIPMKPSSRFTYDVTRYEQLSEGYRLMISFGSEFLVSDWTHKGFTETPDLQWVFDFSSLMIKRVIFDFETHNIIVRGRMIPTNELLVLRVETIGKTCPLHIAKSLHAPWCSDVLKTSHAVNSTTKVVHEIFTEISIKDLDDTQHIPSSKLLEKLKFWKSFTELPTLDEFLQYVQGIPDIIVLLEKNSIETFRSLFESKSLQMLFG